MMKRNGSLLLILLAGMLLSHCIATVHVYLSNAALHQKMTALHSAGYVIVPNSTVTATLKTMKPAIYGGLFFSLTVGAALTLAAFALTWVWGHLFDRSRLAAVCLSLLWAGLLIMINADGVDLLVSAYFVFIPTLVVGFTRWWLWSGNRRPSWVAAGAFLIPILVLAVVWTTLLDRHLFIKLRDQLLLSHPIGLKINDFYYRYTLYPSETFKSLAQKQLKSCTFESIDTPRIAQRLQHALVNHDYLLVSGETRPDLTIVQDGDNLVLAHEYTAVYGQTRQAFFADPVSALQKFSQQTDKYGFFRKVVYLSLLLGFPVFLYAVLYLLLTLLFGWLASPGVSAVLSALVCLLGGIALFFLTASQPQAPIPPKALDTALASNAWTDQLSALRYIVSEQLKIEEYPSHRGLESSPRVAVRYYLARALGASRNPQTDALLLDLLKDPHPNVVCQALAAVGRRGDSRSIPQILVQIQNTDHWYVQWYAYRALRTLGWKQKIFP